MTPEPPRSPTPGSPGGDAVDVLVLGGGSGGYACALRAAQLGLSVALVEHDKLGGTCLHWGCIPTKALLHAADVADHARHASRVGVRTTLDGIDLPAVHAFKDGIVDRLHQGLRGLVAASGVRVVSGHGRLAGPGVIEVGAQRLHGRTVVLATGSRPRTLPGLDLGGTVMTSDDALRMAQLPGRVVALGGGVIGVEFASTLASFGADVTVVEALPHLVPAEDPTISTALERAFRKRGIAVHTGTRLEVVSRTDTSVTVRLGEGSETLEADLLLVAVSRGPRTSGLGYQQAGVVLDQQGYVRTDDRCRTDVAGTYAVGDVVRGLQLAHRGFAQGVFVAEHIAGLDPRPIDETGIPRVTYCEPEIASVGLTEAAARERYPDVSVVEYNLAGNGKSLILATAGLVKVVRAADGPVVGMHMIGTRMSEQVGEAQLIYNWQALPQDVSELVHAHPTQNEALGEALCALAGKPLHTHA